MRVEGVAGVTADSSESAEVTPRRMSVPPDAGAAEGASAATSGVERSRTCDPVQCYRITVLI